jgi:hypothetical protein
LPNLSNIKIFFQLKPAMANPRPLKLFNVALLQSLKTLFCSKIDYIFRKTPNFGPQNDDFSKMWPSSRFGLAMAVLNPTCILVASTTAKLCRVLVEKNGQKMPILHVFLGDQAKFFLFPVEYLDE